MHILLANPGAEVITGYSADELVGRRLPELFGPEMAGEGSPVYRAILTGQRISPTEARLAFDNGVSDILFGIAPLGDISVLSFTDITHLKEVDRIKTNIVANVSHELRTPLASIKAYTELLMDGLGDRDGDVRRQFLSTIDQKADRLGDLIGDLLDLSRLESGQFEMRMELVSIGEIIADVIAIVETEMLEKDVTVHPALPPLPLIVADKQLMTILVRNLVSNAIKFSHQGGRVDLVAREQGNHLVLEVMDQGIGIPAEEIPDLFQKFRRLPGAQAAGTEGSGLGLVLAKEAAEAHNGTIAVRGEEGEGSCFTVRLPLRPSSREPDRVQLASVAGRV
jgi:signal transduction histidine kinase